MTARTIFFTYPSDIRTTAATRTDALTLLIYRRRPARQEVRLEIHRKKWAERRAQVQVEVAMGMI